MSSTKNNNLNAAVDAGIDSGLLANIDSIMDYVGHSMGPVLNDGYTDDLRPTLSGRLPMGEGHVLRVYCNNVVVGYADIGTEGNWTFKPATPLEPGKAYDFQVFLLDSSGNELQPSNTYTIHTTELNHDAAPDAPVITVVHDFAGDHQGPVAQGGKTDDSHPDVSGTAGAHDVVTLSVTSPSGITTVLGSAVADSNGNWDYQLTAAQSITATLGEWTFSATATNTVGTSDSSAGYSVETVGNNADDNTPPDTTPPDAPTITNAYDNVGDSQGDQLFNNGTTDDTTPELRGHAEANSVVKIYEGNTLLGSTTAHSNGSWSFTPSARSEGKHSFFATATDAAGNTSAHSGNFVLNIDVPHIAPAVIEHVVDDHGSQTGDIKNGGTTDDNHPHLSGSAEAGSTVSIHQYDPYTREEYVLGSVVATANGDWDYQLTGGQVLQFGGQSRFWVTTLDSTGNKATSADFKVTLVGENQDDTTAPDAPTIANYYDDFGDSKGFDGNGGTTDDTTPTLNGHAEANSIVKVYEGNTLLGSTTVKADGSWSYTTPARADGKHDFTATATDAAGNASTHSGHFVINIETADTTPPDAPTITNAYDNVGDSQGDQLFNNSTTDDTTPELRGHAEANSIVKVYEGNTLLGSTTAHSDGSWSFTPSARSEGKHSFFATATDAAGNTSTHSGNFVLNIDVPHIAPAVIEHVVDDHGSQTGDIKNGGTTDDNHPHLSGSAEAGSTVSIHQYDPYTREEYVLGSVVAKANGDWDYQLTGGQVLQFGGQSRFWITTLDSTGNKATSADFKVTLVGENQDDTTPPNAPTIANYYDDFGDSKGLDANGGTTDDTTPTLNGQAEANSIVKVYEGSTLLGSTTAHGDGSWSFTPSARSEGKHTFFATATDAAGNTSTHSGNFVVNVELPSLDFKETFESHNGVVFSNSAVYHLDYFDVSVLNRGNSYSPGFNNHREGVSQPVSSTAMILGAGTKVELEMKYPVTDISFKIGDLTTNEVLTVKYFNSHGSVIATQTHTRSEGLLTTASYHTSEGNEIASIQMSLTDSGYPVNYAYVWIDDVTGHATHASTQSLLMPTTHLMALPAEANDVVAHDVTLSTLPETLQHGVVNLNDGNLNTLHLTLNDILSEAHPNLFVQDGKQQLAVTGDQGDVVELKVDDLAHNTWQDSGAVTAGGVQYEVYQHAGSDVELLVQHGLELHQVS